MRKFDAWTLDNWPRRNNNEIIFQSTNEAIYYAHLLDDRLAGYDIINKWRINTLQMIAYLKARKPLNFNRLFDFAVRAQLYRECIEEIERINEEGK